MLLPAAALRHGEKLIDVGCGTGATALAAAQLVGGSGHVTAIDAAANAIVAGKAAADGSFVNDGLASPGESGYCCGCS